MGIVCPHGEAFPRVFSNGIDYSKNHLSLINVVLWFYIIIKMSLYENTEELFGDFEGNDYLCIRYLTY